MYTAATMLQGLLMLALANNVAKCWCYLAAPALPAQRHPGAPVPPVPHSATPVPQRRPSATPVPPRCPGAPALPHACARTTCPSAVLIIFI